MTRMAKQTWSNKYVHIYRSTKMCVKLDVEEDQSYIRFFPVPRISCLEKEKKKKEV